MPRKHQKQKHSKRGLTWLWVILVILAIIVALAILLLQPRPASPLNASASQSPASVEISPAQALAKLQGGAFFLDVRTQDEWNQFHIAGSVLIPLDQLPNRLAEVPRDRDIVVVCLSGHRSLSGTAILQQAGYEQVHCLSGGLQAWIAAGYPVVSGTP